MAVVTIVGVLLVCGVAARLARKWPHEASCLARALHKSLRCCRLLRSPRQLEARNFSTLHTRSSE